MEGKDIIQKEKKVIEGKETKDKVYSSENTFENEEVAKGEFKRSVEKLFNVNKWSDLPGISSSFQLYNNLKVKINRNKVKEGDYIKIDIPGPFPENWVVVAHVNQSAVSAEFTVRPSKEPNEKKNEIKHFFNKEARSMFKVEIKNKRILGYEIGLNEGINNREESGDREVINTLIAEGGWAGFQKFQWKKLTDYLVHKTEIKD